MYKGKPNKKPLFTNHYNLRNHGQYTSTEQRPNVNPRESVSYEDVDYTSIGENENYKQSTETNGILTDSSISQIGEQPVMIQNCQSLSKRSDDNAAVLHSENSIIGIVTKRKSAFDRLGNKRPSNTEAGLISSNYTVEKDNMSNGSLGENSPSTTQMNDSLNVHADNPRKRNNSRSPQANASCKILKSSCSLDGDNVCKDVKSCIDVPIKGYQFDDTDTYTTERIVEYERSSYDDNPSVSETHVSNENRRKCPKERKKDYCKSGQSSAKQENRSPGRRKSHYIESKGERVRSERRRSRSSDRIDSCNRSERKRLTSTERKTYSSGNGRRRSYSSESHRTRVQPERKRSYKSSRERHRSKSRRSCSRGRHREKHRSTMNVNVGRRDNCRFERSRSNYTERNDAQHWSGLGRRLEHVQNRRCHNLEGDKSCIADIAKNGTDCHSEDCRMSNGSRNDRKDSRWSTNAKGFKEITTRDKNKYNDNHRHPAIYGNSIERRDTNVNYNIVTLGSERRRQTETITLISKNERSFTSMKGSRVEFNESSKGIHYRSNSKLADMKITEQRCETNTYSAQGKSHRFNQKKQNGLLESDRKIELEKISRMDADEIAVHLSIYQKEFDIFLWKRKNIENISLLIDILGNIFESSCQSLVQKATYPLKERKFFDRSDIRQIICELRSTESELSERQLKLLKNLLIIIKGLTDHGHGDKTDLLQSLDSLEITSGLKIKDQCQKIEIDGIIFSIRDNWSSKKSKHRDNKISFLSVLPDIDEIDCIGNDIDKTYEDEEGYLNRLFMVHRQDFVRPLCRGLICLKRNLDEDPMCLDRKWKHDDIRVYNNIQFLSKCCNHQNGITWRIEFDPTPYRNINWTTRKVLMHGSLVCLTNKTFDFIHYATVANRDPEELKTGLLEIKLHAGDEINGLMNQEQIILIESQAFFTSYYHTLESIKSIHYKVSNEKGALPFGHQIVNLDTTAHQPEYLKSSKSKELGFDFSCFDPRFGMIDISEESNWPHAHELGIDKSQYEALITAMKSKLALIQGPPGTGKTVVGLKIAKLLLQNDMVWSDSQNRRGEPMLLLSYTNHALDQFLSEILKQVPGLNEQNVVRLGSRSDKADLKYYNLTAHRQRHRYTNNTYGERPFAVAKQNLYTRMIEHKNLNQMKMELNTGIVHQIWLNNAGFMSRNHFKHLEKPGDLIRWLNLQDLLDKNKTGLQKHDDMATYFEDDFDLIDTEEPEGSDDETYDIDFDLENPIFRELDLEEMVMAVSDEVVFHESRPYFKPFWERFTYAEKVLFMRTLKEQIRSIIPLTDEHAVSIIDVWQLSYGDRWRLYKYWIQRVFNAIDAKTRKCEESYERAQDRFTEVQRTTDVKILKHSKLIACTTTRAARDIDILRMVSPKIILMEEAAKIPEHHVVSCLTPSCEQLIMIGDHQQLRPAYNDFHTAKEHQINISLFERLIRAGFPRNCLKYQHRMRPNISKLLVPHIYTVLEDDQSVRLYENVKGVQCNLYFVSHSVQEDNEREEASRSHKNTHEASFICCFYKYLRLQGYKSSQITILSPYLDQVRLLRTMARPIDDELATDCQTENLENNDFSSNTTRGVRITAIDNFQGEENDIILISLVRSNLRRNIGYLNEANRICVALSRAKIGLYLIGDFELLSSKSELWKQIVTDAQNRGFVGNCMSLICQNHKNQTNVRYVKDFEMVKDGGCHHTCRFKRECGHYCSRKCHVADSIHDEKCNKNCFETVCERGHKCGKLCHYPFKCDLCTELVENTIPKCGHSARMPCHKHPSLGACNERCQLMISCGHRCQRTCTEPCNSKDDCNELIKVTARCGHEVQAACHTKNDPPCKLKCQEILLCGHPCSGNCSDCSQGRLHVPCRKRCDRNLVCGHICRKWCVNDCLPCTKECERSCAHNDKCVKRCGDKCINCKEPCDWRCNNTCPNGYKCSKTCSDTCDRPKCNVRCNKKLECGHVCRGLLCENKCIQVCTECNRENISEICCFGTEDENDLVLIHLEDCKCIIEVATLDSYIKSKLDVDSDNEINALKCPKCQTKMTKSNRYRNEIRIINSDIEKVFTAVSSTDEMINLPRKREEVHFIINKCTWKSDSRKIDRYIRMIKKTNSILHLNLIADIFIFLEEIAQLKTNITAIGDYPFLSARTNRLECWTFMKRDRFSEQEHTEFYKETLRLNISLDIKRFKKELADQNKDAAELLEEINDHLCDLESKTKICDEDLSRIREKVKKASSEILGLSIEEKVMIKRAMEKEFMGSGHWYKCLNGHYYSIGECGMPMEERKCPYCNVTIGGRGHMLSEQNEQATDMETI